MPRKGSRKVRTGCITCKIRKVKCDETKPSCTRCTTTGRVCDGYRPQVADARKPAPERAVSLYQPHRVFPGMTTPKEGRALQYFCEAAGPAMSGIVDPYFWTHLVMQLGAFEPAVKHALVAISSLSEQANGPQDVTPAQRLVDQGQALLHYNAAIRQLKAKDSEDQQIVVLVVCILFICIEALRSDVQSAVRHCRHGIEIMKAALPGHPCIKDYLLPIFRRLSISAFYFSDNDGTFLDMPDLWEPPQRSFSTLYDAQRMFDVIIARISHLTLLVAEAGQQTDSQQVRTRTDNTPNTDEHRAEQANINRLLEEWLGLFAELMARIHHAEASSKRVSPKEQYERKVQQVFMLTRYEAGRIWIEMAFDRNVPGARERFLPNFQRVLKQLQWLESQMPESSRSAAAGQRSPQFSFEMGFTAVIFYFVSACPYVEMRLELMRLMRLFGLPKENLWDREVLMAAGRKIIEEENGIKLEDSDRPLTLLSSPRPVEEISTECSPGASDPTPSPLASAISPMESDSLRFGSCEFVFNKTLQSHPWCSMPWSIQIGPNESTGSQEETEIIP